MTEKSKTMSRLKADLALFLVSLIWGAAFLFQKKGVMAMGPFTFVAVRFVMSAMVILPKVIPEYRQLKGLPSGVLKELVFLCMVFALAVVLQHWGLVSTTVTNAGFLTGLYVLFVAMICRFVFKQTVSKYIFPAAFLSVVGVGFLSGGGDLSKMNFGDLMVVFCAVAFGFQVALIGRIMKAFAAPYCVSFLQYALTAAVGGILSLMFEQPGLQDVWVARWDLLYAGVLSGGVAYTLQAVAQQFTPASDSAVIMSLESLFAAVFGVLVNGDAFTLQIAFGAALILAAIVMVEFGPKQKFQLEP